MQGRWSVLVVLALVGGAAAADLHAPADPFCALRSGTCVPPPYVAVVSAFPAELEPLLVAAEVTETIAAGSRTYRIGRLAGTRVLLVRGGIGLLNARSTAIGVLERFPVS